MRKRRPPLRHCRECGAALRAWSEAPLCRYCVRALAARAPAETLRAFRKRVIEGRKP